MCNQKFIHSMFWSLADEEACSVLFTVFARSKEGRCSMNWYKVNYTLSHTYNQFLPRHVTTWQEMEELDMLLPTKVSDRDWNVEGKKSWGISKWINAGQGFQQLLFCLAYVQILVLLCRCISGERTSEVGSEWPFIVVTRCMYQRVSFINGRPHHAVVSQLQHVLQLGLSGPFWCVATGDASVM